MVAYPVISLHPSDGVVIARATIAPGTPVADGVVASERIPPGHKVAGRPYAVGQAVSRYGQIIGFAARQIAPGQPVHVYRRLQDDMDVNCGTILDGEETVEQAGRRISARILRVASGQKTKSEESDFGAAEFAPWQIDATV